MQISFNLGTISFNDGHATGQSVSNQLSDVVRGLREQASKSEKQDDSKMMEKIQAKIKSGKRLTSKEETYLKEHNPELYQQYVRIRKMAEALEQQLKNANSKEEVNDIIFKSINGVSDKDPFKAAIVAAMDEVIKEFKKSDGYKNLPDKKEDATEDKIKTKKRAKDEDDKGILGNGNDEDDDFDVMSWTPLQEVIDAMPSFNIMS
ncbi:MAG: hypothetical protein IJ535_06405 [Pseudobutyrivibrio sp.]|uniref:hypothetical protein n=1 Tax=Pseudobutyrivibrio sp. TaxID=2014367 RepID=UPI0025E3917C|nr:hypothetical protein [Pseudobutyrivibrio sp.]MBQ8489400.1 hypothetical protein [Pseudobutyrivibrio sp.]